MIAFHLGGTPIRIRFSFLLLVSLFLLLDRIGMTMSFFSAVFLHELGHLAAMVWMEIPIRAVELSAFGIAIQRENHWLSLGGELLLYLSGPLVNLILAAIFLKQGSLTGAFHLLLGLLNLLPMEPMDGGNILVLLLDRAADLPPETAGNIRQLLTVLLGGGLFLLGLWLWERRLNPSLAAFAAILLLQPKNK